MENAEFDLEVTEFLEPPLDYKFGGSGFGIPNPEQHSYNSRTTTLLRKPKGTNHFVEDFIVLIDP